MSIGNFPSNLDIDVYNAFLFTRVGGKEEVLQLWFIVIILWFFGVWMKVELFSPFISISVLLCPHNVCPRLFPISKFYVSWNSYFTDEMFLSAQRTVIFPSRMFVGKKYVRNTKSNSRFIATKALIVKRAIWMHGFVNFGALHV